MSDLRVGALVCTKDRDDLLVGCLEALATSLRAAGGTELMVVQAGAGGVATHTEPAATVVSVSQAGKSRQLNRGVRELTADVVVLTDDDCRVDPSWVSSMAAPFEDPTVGIVFGPVTGLSGVRGQSGPAALLPGPATGPTWRYANGAAMAVRRSTVIDIGGYDERMGPGAPQHGEEHDLVLRAIEAGWSVHIADAPPVAHIDWRGDAAARRNFLVYSRGAGAFLGAAVRRRPRTWTRLLLGRLRYQLRLWRFWREEGWSFGPLTTWWFLGGLVAGLRLEPRRWIGSDRPNGDDPPRRLSDDRSRRARPPAD